MMNWAKLLCLAALTPCLLAPSVMADSLARSGVLFGGFNSESGSYQSFTSEAGTKGKEASSETTADARAQQGYIFGGNVAATGIQLYGNDAVSTLRLQNDDDVSGIGDQITGAGTIFAAYLPEEECGNKKSGCGVASLQDSASVHYHYGSGHPDIVKDEHAEEADAGVGGYVNFAGAYEEDVVMKDSFFGELPFFVQFAINRAFPDLVQPLENLQLEVHGDAYLTDGFTQEDLPPVGPNGWQYDPDWDSSPSNSVFANNYIIGPNALVSQLAFEATGVDRIDELISIKPREVPPP
mmetsp:Transcript_10807/g.27272  ORF Transcript_10807/g.27272 Transcript_10807/m.27272 type:complete len:295 (-) Transcript_10807:76-960(-)